MRKKNTHILFLYTLYTSYTLLNVLRYKAIHYRFVIAIYMVILYEILYGDMEYYMCLLKLY